MPDHLPPPTDTPRAAAGTMVDAETGQFVGRIWVNNEDKPRDGRLAKAAAVGRVRARWNKSDFRRFQNGLTQRRRDKDAKALAKVFAEAENIPVFKEALDWARANGIEFFVDRTCTKYVGAYYTGGTGVIGINQRVMDKPALAAIFLTHEIRHAWQDTQGLLGHSLKPDFAQEAIRTALIEADAMAFEMLAAHQSARATLKKREAGSGLPKDLAIRLKRIEKYLENENADLWRGFKGWFESPRARIYSDGIAQRMGAMLGMAEAKPKDKKYEFKPTSQPPPPHAPIDITQDADYQKLGKTFAGGSYLNDAARREFVLRTANSPAEARSYWRGGAQQSKIVKDLRRRELKIKQDEPQLHFSTHGPEGDIEQLAGFLKKHFDAAKDVKAVSSRAPDPCILDITVTFRRGNDPVTAFSRAASGLDGKWSASAPGVQSLFVEGKSVGFKRARGRLDRKAWGR